MSNHSLVQNLTFSTFGQYIKWFPKKVQFFISREFGEVSTCLLGFDVVFTFKVHLLSTMPIGG